MDRRHRSVAATRQQFGRRGWTGIAVVLATLVARPPSASAADQVIRLTDARQAGVFNVRESTATLTRVGDAINLDFRLPPGTAAGVWSKEFPAGFRSGEVDKVQLRVEPSAGSAAIPPVHVSLEIKGKAGTQKLTLPITSRRVGAGPVEPDPVQDTIDWGRVGHVTEVVIAVEPESGQAGAVVGSLRFDIRFVATPWVEALAGSVLGRIIAALLTAGLLGLIGSFLGRLKTRVAPGAISPGVGRDCTLGFALVATLGLGVAVFDFGARPAADYGRLSLLGPPVAAVVGGIIASLWCWGATGRTLSAGEWLRDSAVTGLLAACTSPMAILQAPGTWADTLLLSQTAAAIGGGDLPPANASRLVNSGRHLGAVAGGLIAATPLVFGALILLSAECRGLVAQLGDWITFGVGGTGVTDLAEAVGRIVVLWGFNEAIAAGLGLATKGRISGSIRLHLTLLAASVAAVLAPWAADYGSSGAVTGWAGSHRRRGGSGRG